MSDSDFAPKPAQRATKMPSKSAEPASNPRKSEDPMYCIITRFTRVGPGVVKAQLSTRNRATGKNHPITVGMTGAVVILPGTVEVVGVSPGRAEVVIRGDGIDKKQLTSLFVIIEPNSIARDMYDAIVADPALRGAGVGGSPR